MPRCRPALLSFVLVAATAATVGAGPVTPVTAVTGPVASSAMRAEPVVARFATLNLPGGSTGKQARLLPQPQRTYAALRHLEQSRVEVVALQELTLRSRKVIARAPAWGLVAARPNDAEGAKRVGNAVAYRRDLWRLVDSATLRIAVRGRPRGLNLAVATLQRRRTTAKVTVISTHHPSVLEAGAAATREQMKSREIAYADNVRRTRGVPVIIAGDMNDPRAAATYRRAGYQVGVRHLVDLVVGRGAGLSHGYTRVRGVQGRITDHALPTVLVRIDP